MNRTLLSVMMVIFQVVEVIRMLVGFGIALAGGFLFFLPSLEMILKDLSQMWISGKVGGTQLSQFLALAERLDLPSIMGAGLYLLPLMLGGLIIYSGLRVIKINEKLVWLLSYKETRKDKTAVLKMQKMRRKSSGS